ncbi:MULTISPECIES: WYL domain-containing protein [unclassified Roseovarius]|uniref:WYL domain-containing protein n=1 Tax=unclassified Roseovarius TaxID=2614913 RepID=UPI00273D784E|nr:WYL domain-containing protein [Roseovarius sp. MMSF_3350]
MKNNEAELRWDVEQKLDLIEFRLFWEGHVNRSDLMNQFGISANQASADLNRYLGFAPNNMVYDKSARTYVRCSAFDAKFQKLDKYHYLTQLRTSFEGLLSTEDAWIAKLPAFDSAPTPVRGIAPKILRDVVGAINKGEAIEVLYKSLTRPHAIWRWIAPHAIAYDGFRWHARAWCEIDGAYKDFVLSRIRKVQNSRAASAEPCNDLHWNTKIALRIAPHPDLSSGQKDVIAQDYGMQNGSTTILVRKALEYYALKRLGLDTDPDARRPQDQKIVLIGKEAVS